MKFDQKMEKYYEEYKGIMFVWNKQPENDVTDMIKKLAENYYENLEKIVSKIEPQIKSFYGEVSFEEIKDKLGKPIVNCDIEVVTYLEQSFDSEHIFSFEFANETFENIYRFTIDG